MPNPITPRHHFKEAPNHIHDYLAPSDRVNELSVYTDQDSSQESDRGIIEGGRCIACKAPACETTIELHEMLPGCQINHPPAWLTEVGNDNFSAALALHNRTSKLGLFYGLLCPAPCEDGCTMGPLKGGAGPVNIHEVEAVIYQWAIREGVFLDSAVDYRPFRIGKRVAIVGGGVAGIEAADLLNREGIEVHIFEKRDQIGGILRWEIPHYKFPAEFPQSDMVELHRELYEAEGVTFHCNSPIMDKESAADLVRDFDAVLLCPGAPVPNYGSIPSNFRKHPAVLEASTYLESLKRDGESSPYSPKGKVVIVAGNRDTAADCIGQTIRGGADHVYVLDRNPAKDKEYTSHQELRELKKGSVVGNRVIESVEELGSRRLRVHLKAFPEGIGGVKREVLEADLLISALGYIGAETKLSGLFQVPMSPTRSRGLLYNADSTTGVTNNPKVWVAGDGVLGASLLMTAGASGRRAGQSILTNLTAS